MKEFTELEKELKRNLKKKVPISQSMIVTALMCGISMAANGSLIANKPTEKSRVLPAVSVKPRSQPVVARVKVEVKGELNFEKLANIINKNTPIVSYKNSFTPMSLLNTSKANPEFAKEIRATTTVSTVLAQGLSTKIASKYSVDLVFVEKKSSKLMVSPLTASLLAGLGGGIGAILAGGGGSGGGSSTTVVNPPDPNPGDTLATSYEIKSLPAGTLDPNDPNVGMIPSTEILYEADDIVLSDKIATKSLNSAQASTFAPTAGLKVGIDVSGGKTVVNSTKNIWIYNDGVGMRATGAGTVAENKKAIVITKGLNSIGMSATSGATIKNSGTIVVSKGMAEGINKAGTGMYGDGVGTSVINAAYIEVNGVDDSKGIVLNSSGINVVNGTDSSGNQIGVGIGVYAGSGVVAQNKSAYDVDKLGDVYVVGGDVTAVGFEAKTGATLTNTSRSLYSGNGVGMKANGAGSTVINKSGDIATKTAGIKTAGGYALEANGLGANALNDATGVINSLMGVGIEANNGSVGVNKGSIVSKDKDVNGADVLGMGIGMRASGPNTSITNFAGGTIAVGGVGMEANFGEASNYGTINVSNTQFGAGIGMSSNNGTATNFSIIDVVGSGVGMNAIGSGSSINNNIINIDNGKGMVSDGGSATVTNAVGKTISISGSGIGMVANAGSAINSGTISFTADNALAVGMNSTAGVAINKGNITVSNATGMKVTNSASASTSGSTITNAVGSTITVTGTGVGMSTDIAKSVIEQSGTINVTGAGTGIYLQGTDIVVKTTGSINLSDAGSRGVWIKGGGTLAANIRPDFFLTVNGSGGTAFYVDSGYANNSGAITMSGSGNGMVAVNDSVIANLSTLTVENGVALSSNGSNSHATNYIGKTINVTGSGTAFKSETAGAELANAGIINLIGANSKGFELTKSGVNVHNIGTINLNNDSAIGFSVIGTGVFGAVSYSLGGSINGSRGIAYHADGASTITNTGTVTMTGNGVGMEAHSGSNALNQGEIFVENGYALYGNGVSSQVGSETIGKITVTGTGIGLMGVAGAKITNKGLITLEGAGTGFNITENGIIAKNEGTINITNANAVGIKVTGTNLIYDFGGGTAAGKITGNVGIAFAVDGAGSTLTNSGILEMTNSAVGMIATNSGKAINTNQITVTNGVGMKANSNGTVQNNANATINVDGTGIAMSTSETGTTITNNGNIIINGAGKGFDINGSNINITSLGTIILKNSAAIGVSINGALQYGTDVNGIINGTAGTGFYATGGATVTNRSTVSMGGTGVGMTAGASSTVINDNDVIITDGIGMYGKGSNTTITNNANKTITVSGTGVGMLSDGTGDHVNNAGDILLNGAGIGIELTASGVLVSNTGTITLANAGAYGIVADGVGINYTFSDSGMIRGTQGTAYLADNGAQITSSGAIAMTGAGNGLAAKNGSTVVSDSTMTIESGTGLTALSGSTAINNDTMSLINGIGMLSNDSTSTITNNSGKTITVTGSGKGMVVIGGTGTNNGIIDLSSAIAGSVGMVSENGTATNNNTITVSDAAIGMNSTGGSIVNNHNINLNNATGMKVSAIGGNASNIANSTITVTGTGSAMSTDIVGGGLFNVGTLDIQGAGKGMYLTNSGANAINTGLITLSNSDAVGIYVKGLNHSYTFNNGIINGALGTAYVADVGEITLSVVGTVEMTGAGNGMKAINSGKVTNNSTITVENGSGLIAASGSAVAKNLGAGTINVKGGGFGMQATASGTTLINEGLINLEGANSKGFELTASGVSISNTGTINIANDTAYGIYVVGNNVLGAPNGIVYTFTGGSITGSRGTAYKATNSATINNNGTVAMTGTGTGVEASTNAVINNNSDITVEDGIAMKASDTSTVNNTGTGIINIDGTGIGMSGVTGSHLNNAGAIKIFGAGTGINLTVNGINAVNSGQINLYNSGAVGIKVTGTGMNYDFGAGTTPGRITGSLGKAYLVDGASSLTNSGTVTMGGSGNGMDASNGGVIINKNSITVSSGIGMRATNSTATNLAGSIITVAAGTAMTGSGTSTINNLGDIVVNGAGKGFDLTTTGITLNNFGKVSLANAGAVGVSASGAGVTYTSSTSDSFSGALGTAYSATNEASLINKGTITMTGSGNGMKVTGAGAIYNDGIITVADGVAMNAYNGTPAIVGPPLTPTTSAINRAGATINVTGSGIGFLANTPGTLVENEGLILITGPGIGFKGTVGGIIAINTNGTITTAHDDAFGLYIQNTGVVQIPDGKAGILNGAKGTGYLVKGSSNFTSSRGLAMTGTGNGYLVIEGALVTSIGQLTIENGVGMNAMTSGIVKNDSTITLKNGIGMKSSDATGTAINNSAGKITVSGTGVGMYASGGSARNDGSILFASTAGGTATGMVTDNNGTIINGGTINLTGATATVLLGMDAKLGIATNDGTIIADNDIGMKASSATSVVKNNATKIIEVNGSGIAMAGSSVGATLNNAGIIDLKGAGARGFELTSNGINVVNTGTINLLNASAIAVKISGTNTSYAFAAGNISGTQGLGFYADGVGATAINSGTSSITMTGAGNGMEAINQGSAINNSIITIENGIGLKGTDTGSTISNQAGGTITVTGSGVGLRGTASGLTMANFGTINLIGGNSIGMEILASGIGVTNSGIITLGHATATGTVVRGSGLDYRFNANVSGLFGTAYLADTSAIVTNDGTIAMSKDVSVSNSGSGNGMQAIRQGTVINNKTITVSDGYAMYSNGASTNATNNANGTITVLGTGSGLTGANGGNVYNTGNIIVSGAGKGMYLTSGVNLASNTGNITLYNTGAEGIRVEGSGLAYTFTNGQILGTAGTAYVAHTGSITSATAISMTNDGDGMATMNGGTAINNNQITVADGIGMKANNNGKIVNGLVSGVKSLITVVGSGTGMTALQTGARIQNDGIIALEGSNSKGIKLNVNGVTLTSIGEMILNNATSTGVVVDGAFTYTTDILGNIHGASGIGMLGTNGATLTNGGKIEMSQSGNGMLAKVGGNVANSGTITVVDGIGMSAEGASSGVTNNATHSITVSGTGTAMKADVSGGIVNNAGNILITGAGKGINLTANGITVTNTGTITLNNDNAYGIVANGSGLIYTFGAGGTITGAKGIAYLADNGARLTNGGTISMTGTAKGIVATNGGVIFNDGSITVVDGIGMSAIGTTEATNNLSHKITVEGAGTALLGTSGSKLFNEGDIDLKGAGAKGFNLTANGITVTNNGTIKLLHAGAYGIAVTGTGVQYTFNSGAITGEMGTAYLADASGRVTNGGTIDMTGIGNGMEATNAGSVINNNSITVIDGVGMKVSQTTTTGATATNNAGKTITVSGTGSAMMGTASGSSLINSGNFVINGGGRAYTLTANGVTIIKNAGSTINLNNDSAYGIAVSGSGVEYTFNGVAVTGSQGTAFLAEKSGKLTNSQSFSMTGTGSGLEAQTGQIINTGTLGIVDGVGMRAFSSSNATNTGTINITGAGYGMLSNYSVGLNTGTINVNGLNSYGMWAVNGGTVSNDSLITVTTSTGTGMYATGGANSIATNRTGKTINVTGSGIAMAGNGDGSVVTNAGTLNLTGDGARGFDITEANVGIANTGTINVGHANAIGVKVTGAGLDYTFNTGSITGSTGTAFSVDAGKVTNGGGITMTGTGTAMNATNLGNIINNGNIRILNGIGMKATGDGTEAENTNGITVDGTTGVGLLADTGAATIKNTGTITVTSSGIGMSANSSSATIDNTGSIILNGDGSRGLLLTAGGITVSKIGVITINNLGAYGVEVRGNGSVGGVAYTFNGGTISGSLGTAYLATNYGDASNGGTITMTSGGNGMASLTSGRIYNYGNITVADGIGMNSNASAINTATKTITVTGSGIAMSGGAGSTLTNNGIIELTGIGAKGLNLTANGITYSNTGEIRLSNDDAYGIAVTGNGVSYTFTSGTITGTAGTGYLADNQGVIISSSNITLSGNAKAMEARRGGSVTNKNIINVADAYAMAANDNGSTATNFAGATINVNGIGAGLVGNTSGSTLTNDGTIDLKAAKSVGFLINASGVTIGNIGTITLTNVGAYMVGVAGLGSTYTIPSGQGLTTTKGTIYVAKDNGTLFNDSDITINSAGNTGSAIDAIDGGTSTNNVGKTITVIDSNQGMKASNNGTSINLGTITRNSASTPGTGQGAMSATKAGSVINKGTINGTTTYGITASADGASGLNDIGATISSTVTDGMVATNGGTITNRGTISSAGYSMKAIGTSTAYNYGTAGNIMATGAGSNAYNYGTGGALRAEVQGTVVNGGSGNTGTATEMRAYGKDANNGYIWVGATAINNVGGKVTGQMISDNGGTIENRAIDTVGNPSALGISGGSAMYIWQGNANGINPGGLAINRGVLINSSHNIMGGPLSQGGGTGGGTWINYGTLQGASASEMSSGNYGNVVLTNEVGAIINHTATDGFGMVALNSGNTSTLLNNGTIIVKGDSACGMALVGSGTITNSGTIDLTGATNSVGIYGQYSGVSVRNTGTIKLYGASYTGSTANGKTDSKGNQAIQLVSGATFVSARGGLLKVDGVLDMADISSDGTGKLMLEGGTIEAEAIKGDLYASGALAMGSFENDYTTYKMLKTNKLEGKIISNSGLFDAQITKEKDQYGYYDVRMYRKNFNDILSNKSLANVLEKNYFGNSAVDNQKAGLQIWNAKLNYYDALKLLATEQQIYSGATRSYGGSIYPVTMVQTQRLVGQNSNTLFSTLQEDTNQETRYIAYGDYSAIERDTSGEVSGYKTKYSTGTFGFDKGINTNLRAGIVGTYGHADTEFKTDSGKRNDDIYQLNANATYNYKGIKLSTNIFGGIANGDISRTLSFGSIYDKMESNIKNSFYGGNVGAQKSFSLGKFDFTSVLGMTITQTIQDEINEQADDFGIKVDKQEVTSLQPAASITLSSDIELKSGFVLKPEFTAKYAYELGEVDPVKTTLTSVSQDKVELEKYETGKNTGTMSVGVELRKGDLSTKAGYEYVVDDYNTETRPFMKVKYTF